MSMEAALLESRTLRASMCERVEALDKVKVLVVLPDGLHVTSQMVADYFEVGERAVNSLIQRHRAELQSNGFVIVKPVDNSGVESFNLKSTQVRGRGLALFPRRAVLNVAMLLRDSEVARQVRSHLLDVVETAWRPEPEPEAEVITFRARPWKGWNQLRWDEYEAVSSDPAAEAWRRKIDGVDPFEPVGKSVGKSDGCAVEDRLGAIERRLETQRAVIVAMGERICRHSEDLTAIRRDVAWLRGHRSR